MAGKKKTEKQRSAKRLELSHAVSLSKSFHGMPARFRKRLSVNWPKALTSLGRCMRLDYLSGKYDGKSRIYWHEFDDPPELYAVPGRQPGGKTMLIIVGNFKIKEAGITG